MVDLLVIFSRRGAPSNRNRIGPRALVESKEGDAGGAHAWQGGYPLLDLLIEVHQSRVLFVAYVNRIDRKQKDVVLVESRVQVGKVHQAAKEQSGGDQQHERQRHLGNNQRLRQRTAARDGSHASSLFERGAQVDPSSPEGRGNSK